MANFNIPGLLGKIAGLPNVIGQGLLGDQSVNPGLGLDPSMLATARKQSLQDLAMGLMAGGPGMSQGQRLMSATQNARQGFQGRVFDALKEQELIRMNQERDKRQAGLDAMLAAMRSQPGAEQLANLAAANPEAFTQEAIKANFAGGGESWRPLTDKEIAANGLDPQSDWQVNTATGKIDRLYSPPASPTVNVNLPPNESKFLEGLGKNAADQLNTLQTQADSASRSLANIGRVEKLVDSKDFISGVLGEPRLAVAKALGLAGAEETQVYFAAVGDQVAERIKAFGAGTGLSDKDREFAEKIAAGSITLTADAIRRLIKINKQSANAVIDLYGQRRDFYKQKHPEVSAYYPEIKGSSLDAEIDGILNGGGK